MMSGMNIKASVTSVRFAD